MFSEQWMTPFMWALGAVILLAIFWGPITDALGNLGGSDDNGPPPTPADTWSSGEIDGFAACRFDGGAVASCVRRIKRGADRGTIEAFEACTEDAEDSDYVIEDYDDPSFYIQDCFDGQEPAPEPVHPE
jgi:hypothetical protein